LIWILFLTNIAILNYDRFLPPNDARMQW